MDILDVVLDVHDRAVQFPQSRIAVGKEHHNQFVFTLQLSAFLVCNKQPHRGNIGRQVSSHGATTGD
ncbi:hypothetical protein [Paenibacillus campinasensis]|uniref:hypothetical protein n=1 Tax=Paenibacillus campinasensis TaxID=66347 RepID=UPI001C5286F9|nr:hypothetical protein [Paenibacillus campinasensis]